MRKIKYNDWVNGAWQTDFPNEALLHNFFTDPDNESRALIELPNGQVTDVRSDRIKFVEPASESQSEIQKSLDYMAEQLNVITERLEQINESIWKK